MSQDSYWVIIYQVQCIKVTMASILVEIDGTQHYIPTSQLHRDANEVYDVGDVGDLVMPRWLALEKELEFTDYI